jgi:hypothetical protein
MSDLPLEYRAVEGGAVVVTRFACRSRRQILLIRWLHYRMKPAVEGYAPGFLGVRLYIDWRRRVVRSVSLWSDLASLYGMGDVREHIEAARIPRRLGIATTCGIYTFEGECSAVMFGVERLDKPNPLTDPHPNRSTTSG